MTRQTGSIEPIGRTTSIFKQLMSLHWMMAACFLLVYITGAIVARLQTGAVYSGPKGLLSVFHQSIGVLVMMLLIARILLLIRVVWRKYSRRLPTLTFPWILQFTLHAILYGLMLVAPVTGLLIANSYGSQVPFFGLATVTPIFAKNEAVVETARSLHFWFSYLFLACIMLHILAHWHIVRRSWRQIQATMPKVWFHHK
ncbi:cytochrome b [Chamaesiphon sp.]|uniref:cytochrome b n=1 Tax=Chamaesiphon sp. TaxID=2814140 RepID=UPI003593313B